MQVLPHPTGQQLGAQLAEYKPGTSKIIVLGALLILVGLPILIGGIVLSRSANLAVYSNSSNTPELWILSAGVILSLIGIIVLILAWKNRKLRARCYELGFVFVNKDGAREVRWDQVTQVLHKEEEVKTSIVKDPKTGESTPTTSKIATDVYIIQCADGSTCEIDTSLYGLSAFGPAVEQAYPRFLFPRLLASYRAGNPIAFGTLTVSPAGVSNSDGPVHLSWGSFQGIQVERKKGEITIRRGSEVQPWSTISPSSTPNIAVFESLVNTLAQQPR